jgi:hypothetical protein
VASRQCLCDELPADGAKWQRHGAERAGANDAKDDAKMRCQDAQAWLAWRNKPVPGVPGLSVRNIDPGNAAESYRQCVFTQ